MANLRMLYKSARVVRFNQMDQCISFNLSGRFFFFFFFFTVCETRGENSPDKKSVVLSRIYTNRPSFRPFILLGLLISPII